MTVVFISKNPLDASAYERHECEDVPALVYDFFDGKRPENLRFYNGSVCDQNDVTPTGVDGVSALNELDGPIYALAMPSDPIGGGLLLLGAVVAGVAASFALLPKPPVVTQPGAFNQPSPNNELASRQNKPRIGKRIPDIFGTVRSTPDLIAVPYNIFESNIDKEIAYLCIGRGEYSVSDIRDGTTLVSEIDGASVEVYGPDNSPNLASPGPDQTIGDAIGRAVITVERTSAVNGQVAEAANSLEIASASTIRFTAEGDISINSSDNIDFREFFADGDTVVISDSSYTGASGSYNFDGTYTVSGAVAELSFSLSNPGAVNSDWNNLTAEAGEQTGLFSPTLRNGNSKVIGPFVVGDSSSTGIIINYVALSGLWRSDGETQSAIDVTVRATVSKSGETDETFDTVLNGSSSLKSSIGVTGQHTPTFSGPYSVSFERLTQSPKEEGYTVTDDVKVRDLYATSPVSATDFGDVTTIMTKTEATAGALSVKERKLNCLVTRKIPKRNGDGTFTSNQTDYNVRDILIFVARDQYIGNRADSEIDMAGIAAQIADNESYFGSSDGAEFNYTFDSDNISFEETFTLIADAAFCTAYREGDQLKIRLEKPQSSGTMLFNHRNILPGSQRQTVRFGRQNNHDGVEYDYVNPDDGSIKTIQLPAGDLVNPRRIESVGIRNDNQAHWHLSRAWNKIQYQNVTQEFESLEHALLLNRMERIMAADTTRADTQDGDVLGQDGLTLTLSQPVALPGSGTNYIWLMYNDGTIDSIEIAAGATDYEVVLQSSPSGTIKSDSSTVLNTPFIVTNSADQAVSALMVDDIDPLGGSENTVRVSALLYDARFYDNDGDASPH